MNKKLNTQFFLGHSRTFNQPYENNDFMSFFENTSIHLSNLDSTKGKFWAFKRVVG